jgi:hypothetical protein
MHAARGHLFGYCLLNDWSARDQMNPWSCRISTTMTIDRAFVRDIPGDEEDKAIAKAIISLGRDRGTAGIPAHQRLRRNAGLPFQPSGFTDGNCRLGQRRFPLRTFETMNSTDGQVARERPMLRAFSDFPFLV